MAKNDIYKCLLCEHEVHTEQRDAGETPKLIGCTQSGCFGVCQSRFGMVENTKDSEVTFMVPKNANEWQIIREQIEKEVRDEFPNKRKSKVYKTTERLLFQLKHVVKNGGVCPMPSKVVSFIKKQ